MTSQDADDEGRPICAKDSIGCSAGVLTGCDRACPGEAKAYKVNVSAQFNNNRSGRLSLEGIASVTRLLWPEKKVKPSLVTLSLIHISEPTRQS